MGLEAVKEEVIRSARNKEQSLIAEARKKTSEIMKKAEEKAEAIKIQINTETKQLMDTIKKQELASAELENKKAILEAKKQLIESVFSKVQKKVEDLDSKKRQAYINKLLEKAKNDITVADVYCNEKDIKLVKGFSAKKINITGGLIAENKEKTVRVDYSFDTMLQNIKENELQSINKILFA
jgi:V/A-type H+/Na+-transporting ATPase subunit E